MKIPGIVKNDRWLSPYSQVIRSRMQKIRDKLHELTPDGKLSTFATGHLYFGLHRTANGYVLREWAPNASAIYLIGDFNGWNETREYSFTPLDHGNWELLLEGDRIKHGDLYKLSMHWEGGKGERIPAYCRRAVQDDHTKLFSAQVWFPENELIWKHPVPENNDPPIIYEAHIGMATEEMKVGQYREFRLNVLPRIIAGGYNTIQLMAIQEHPYYGSFGYHVSNLFAASSRFGEPEELKLLIDEAHGAGLRVIMDIVHSHAVKNENEGLGLYDGSPWQYFHSGNRREHTAWDSLCYDYGKNEVLHFLLSNIQFWLKEYRFDGFRFDGVTSMIYYNHGLGHSYTNYSMYFDGEQDEDALSYLALANILSHEINPEVICIAEDMSGYPGLASKIEDGGIGFDYRLAMGTPDYWIRLIKEKSDEHWNVAEMYHELTNKRAEEKTIGYAESHDQALVGDKTIIFRLIDKDMYWSMDRYSENLLVDRGIALHKMIRLITLATSGNGYLNFMGNEFGHPEWIDFPREGNNWSYHYARRQWSLVDNDSLRYRFLDEFDRQMIRVIRDHGIFKNAYPGLYHENPDGQVLGFERDELFFIFNFNPVNSFPDYIIHSPQALFRVILDTDETRFGGQGRIDQRTIYRTNIPKNPSMGYSFRIYLPARTGIVLRKEKIKRVYDIS